MAVAAALAPLEAFLKDPDVNERAELILGKVYEPGPESSGHFTMAVDLVEALKAVFTEVAVFREAPLEIPDRGYLKPDALVMRGPRSAYGRPMHYMAEDIQIVIEVSASTASRDFGRKDLQYAQAGIPEYWIVDVDNGRVVRQTQPTSLGYANQELFGPNDSIAGISVADFLVKG
ncbi:Uma2 family endonuclease [bacterium]|nr:MAG: Uma2 family endonuclease [bacterium]